MLWRDLLLVTFFLHLIYAYFGSWQGCRRRSGAGASLPLKPLTESLSVSLSLYGPLRSFTKGVERERTPQPLYSFFWPSLSFSSSSSSPLVFSYPRTLLTLQSTLDHAHLDSFMIFRHPPKLPKSPCVPVASFRPLIIHIGPR